MTAAASTEDPSVTVQADPQDPLPESNWGPRRWFAFLSLAAYVLLRAYGISKGEVSAWGLDVFALTNAILYLVAPSAEQVSKMILSAGAMKAGVVFKSKSTADAATGVATTETSAGQTQVGQGAVD